MQKKNYDDMHEEIINEYLALRNVQKVSRSLRIAPGTVSRIVREAGYVLRGRGGTPPVRKAKPQPPKDSCMRCRSCSRISSFEGYCLKHRRTVKLRSIESCFN